MATTFLRSVLGREEFTHYNEGVLAAFGVMAKGKRVWGLLFVGERGEVVPEDRREESRVIFCCGFHLLRHRNVPSHLKTFKPT